MIPGTASVLARRFLFGSAGLPASRPSPRQRAGGDARRQSPVYLASVTCPRISPPGLAAVWMFRYQSPSSRSLAWSSVSVADPLIGLASAPLNGTTGPAFLPGFAGPWKWAIVGSPDRPE